MENTATEIAFPIKRIDGKKQYISQKSIHVVNTNNFEKTFFVLNVA